MLLMRDVMPQKGTDTELESISPILYLKSDFPPAFVMTAEGDFLASQATLMVDKLKSLDVPVEYHYYGDKEHPLEHVFHLNIRSEAAKRCNDEECAFFRRHIIS